MLSAKHRVVLWSAALAQNNNAKTLANDLEPVLHICVAHSLSNEPQKIENLYSFASMLCSISLWFRGLPHLILFWIPSWWIHTSGCHNVLFRTGVSVIPGSISQWHKSVSDFTHIHVSKCWRQPWSPTIWSSDLKRDSWLFIVSQALLCVSYIQDGLDAGSGTHKMVHLVTGVAWRCGGVSGVMSG